MLAGISTACMYPELTERALQYIAGAGAEACEIFINAPSELEDNFVKELRRIADGGGTKVISVHLYNAALEPLTFFSNYRRRFLDGIEEYKRFFHAANLLGAGIFVLHGDYRGSGRPYAHYFERFAELAEAGRAMGVTVAQENVERCTSWSADFFRAMRESLPEARFVFDVKQCIRAGNRVDEMLDAMGDRIIHVHVSDHAPGRDCLPIGQGTMDLPALLRRLRAQEFDGGVLLELYRDNYGEYGELIDSYRQILSAVQELEAL